MFSIVGELGEIWNVFAGKAFYTSFHPVPNMPTRTMPDTLYLDSNATTHVLPAAITAATRAMREQFGNPSSSHSHGIVAKALTPSTVNRLLGNAPALMTSFSLVFENAASTFAALTGSWLMP